MADDTVAKCVTCGARIVIRFERSIERTLALYLAALILFVVANAFPILTMSIGGQANASTVLDGARALYDDGMWPLALAVALAGTLCCHWPRSWACWRSWCRCSRRRPPWIVKVFRWVERLQPWSMMEVYLLGVIVAYVKLQDLATVHLGIAICRLRRHDLS